MYWLARTVGSSLSITFVPIFLSITALHRFMFFQMALFYHTYGQEIGPGFGQHLKSGPKLEKERQNPMGSHRLGQVLDVAALLLPIRLKSTGRKSV